MPNWLLKTAIHHAISWLPRRQFWNGLFQTYVTKSTVFTPVMFEGKVVECNRHFSAFRSQNQVSAEFNVFELGTGWFPVIPLGLFLCGAKELWTIDIDPLLQPARLKQVLEGYCAMADRGDLAKLLPALRPDRLKQLRSLLPFARNENPSALLARINIHVIVTDAQKTPVSPGCIDFFISSGVLEYIPRTVLQGIFREFRRVAAPGAVMSHRLNLVDQFSYFDPSITAFNFLRYEENRWRWLNSPLIWQNRLRISDFRGLITEAGFEITREESTQGTEAELSRVELAPEFRGYTRQDLLVLHSFLTASLPSTQSVRAEGLNFRPPPHSP